MNVAVTHVKMEEHALMYLMDILVLARAVTLVMNVKQVFAK